MMDELAALLERAERAGQGTPPVESWHPDSCGAMDMVIRSDGVWLHEGRPILRAELTRLFSTILRKDADGETYLVTPAEKLRITVDDAPFLAVELAAREAGTEGQALTFRTNMGDVVSADAGHPIRLTSGADGFAPYILVRGRLEARLTRAVAYELAQLVEEDGDGFFLRSHGARFDIPASQLADQHAE